MIHELKTAPVYFNRSWSGEKLFEVRKNDRHFQKWDGIILMEWDGLFNCSNRKVNARR